MKLRLRSSVLSMLSLTLGAFAACTFGAEDFKIVSGGPGSGGDGSGDSTSTAGDNQGGDANTSGSATGGQGGASATGGEPSLGGESGAAGAATTPRFICSPQAEAFTVMSPQDHQLQLIDDVELATGPSGLVVIASGEGMAGVGAHLAYRSVSDTNGGKPEGLGTVNTMGVRLHIAAATVTQQRELRIMGLDDTGFFEYTSPLPLNGQPFPPAARRDIIGAEQCSTFGNGHVRDVHGDYGPTGLGFAFTCAGPNDSFFQLFLSEPGMPGAAPEPIQTNGDISAIVRRYVRTPQHNFLLVGDEQGPSIGVRYGSDAQALTALYSIGLSDDPKVFSSLNAKLFPTGLLISGAAFTTDGPNPPPLVPASVYVGVVDDAAIPDLFRGTPPANLHKIVTFTKASELVGFEDAIPTVGNNVLGVGVHFTAKDQISAALATPSGEILAEPTEIYRSANGAFITDHTLHVASFGLGAIIVWAEANVVKARTFACLPD